MNREYIIRMAREAWLSEKEAELISEFDEAYISCTYLEDLERFAQLVAAAEREEMLDLVLGYAKNNTDLIEAIRARGQQ